MKIKIKGKNLFLFGQNKIGISNIKKRDILYRYLYLVPALLILSIFTYIPIFNNIRMSFYNIHMMRLEYSFVGLQQYIQAFSDPLMSIWIRNTMLFVVIVVPLTLLLGLGFALALNFKFLFKPVVQALIFLPWVLPEVVVSAFWKLMLDGNSGIINELLVRLNFISDYQSWLGDTRTALISTAIVMVWRVYPFITILLLAGLQIIPENLYEAAAVDGANRFQSFLYITVPSLRYMLIISVTIASLWALQQFTIIYVLTGVGPASASEVLSIAIYNTAFSFYRLSRAASLSIFLFIIVLIPTIIYIKQIRIEE